MTAAPPFVLCFSITCLLSPQYTAAVHRTKQDCVTTGFCQSVLLRSTSDRGTVSTACEYSLTAFAHVSTESYSIELKGRGISKGHETSVIICFVISTLCCVYAPISKGTEERRAHTALSPCHPLVKAIHMRSNSP
ncbi:hypothetical protein F5890DRAFT_84257 [Lentinula detonsa]|uniref:Uncharacterized protein n=1 Tax=Lentinula detonsa TaxID=2804962 RepID=A0AA38Q7U8_9AGAR|nr:hypothetical protein F5890DRAFT_84257 [Lentinula detonsa]